MPWGKPVVHLDLCLKLSYTLASHVPIYIAMFISLPVAALAIVGIGFIEFPLVVALEHFSYYFVVIGLCIK